MNLKRVHVHAVVLIIFNTTTRKKWSMRNTKKDVFLESMTWNCTRVTSLKLREENAFTGFKNVMFENKTELILIPKFPDRVNGMHRR